MSNIRYPTSDITFSFLLPPFSFYHYLSAMTILLRIGFLALLVNTMVSCAYTPKIRLASGEVDPASITEEFPIRIGGIKQYMMIRGADRNNPILLYIHGGPGKSEMPLQRIYNSELEKHFVVVTWDQRGAGKTNRILGDVKDFTLKAYLDDTREVVQYLKQRFGHEKMFLVGHSWGSLLGLLTVHESPRDFYAYVGIGQITGLQQNIVETYRRAKQYATEENNERILSKLAGMQIDEGDFSDVRLRDILYVRNYVRRKMPEHNMKMIYPTLVRKSVFSPEYSTFDVIRGLIGISGSIDFLKQNNLSSIDMYKIVRKVEVPFFIFSGVQDALTDPALTRAYFDYLEAPYKKFVLFEKSTHHPNYEETERYNSLMIDEVKPVGLEFGGQQ